MIYWSTIINNKSWCPSKGFTDAGIESLSRESNLKLNNFRDSFSKKLDGNHYASVVEVGPGNLNDKGETIKLTVQKGDTVLLPDYGGVKVKMEVE